MRVSKRQRRLAAQKLYKKPEDKFESVDLATANYVPPGMTRCFRNNRFTVMIFDNTPTTAGPATAALIQNHTNTPIVNHWAVLQTIKNKLFGAEVTAIEYYPAESEVINVHNIYWLVIYPDGILPKLLFPGDLSSK